MFLSTFPGTCTAEEHRELSLRGKSEARWEEEKGRRDEMKRIMNHSPTNAHGYFPGERFQNSKGGRLVSDINFLPTCPWVPVSLQVKDRSDGRKSPYRLSPMAQYTPTLPSRPVVCRPIDGEMGERGLQIRRKIEPKIHSIEKPFIELKHCGSIFGRFCCRFVVRLGLEN